MILFNANVDSSQKLYAMPALSNKVDALYSNATTKVFRDSISYYYFSSVIRHCKK